MDPRAVVTAWQGSVQTAWSRATGQSAAAQSSWFDGLLNGAASFGQALLDNPLDALAAAGGAGLVAIGATGEVAGALLDATGVGAVVGIPTNLASAGLIGTGAAITTAALGDLAMHAATDSAVTPAGDRSADNFRGSEYDQDEIEEFVNGHTGDGNPVMNRPSQQDVHEALNNATPEPLFNKDGSRQNAEQFDYKGTRVIVNYDMPWRSTSYKIGQ